MSLDRTPIDVAALSAAAQKAISGPAPMKMMAARGMAPLTQPADVVTVLYQLSLDADNKICSAANKTAAELPDKVLGPALTSDALDARVIDFFADRVIKKVRLVQTIVLNKATANETVQTLAKNVGAALLDLIAQNEQRLLAAPGIIGAMYMNPKARMSTVDRAVELAVRNNVQVPGIPAWDEVVAGVMGAKVLKEPETPTPPEPTPEEEALDEAFTAAAEAGIDNDSEKPAEDSKEVPIAKLSIPAKIRLAILGNKSARNILLRDANKQVAMAAIRSPKMTEGEVAKLSTNRSLLEPVMRYIVNNRDWTKSYQVKVNLVNNPKCPIQTAMRFLPTLSGRDLNTIARSKGVPAAVSQRAKKLSLSKRG